ncbi:GPR1/FUN34/YaaH family transporter [Pseudonocardia endophytica]|uniref:Uncharacterized protein n=1 Tax=Pseudonocardia endophytica TaxID=401976 RepID=A0A4R1HEB5_PSEEN|nr:GPR1/FUN34/YaaH family transporter [Pseudonocardia endophytica]TCK20434.1 hypothetical protein EV378_4393 [Pseudonocardia endophytica]
MSVESDTAGAHAAAEAPPATPAPNPTAMGLITFIPGGMILGLWFVGYLPTSELPGGMIPIVLFCTGLFELITTVLAIRAGQNAVGAIFGVFSSFWISFGVLLLLLNNGLIINATGADAASQTLTTAQSFQIQAAYLLAYTVTFILLTLFTLRLPIAFTTAFVFVTVTFVLAYLGVALGATGLFPIAGITTFIFTLLFAYILFDAFNQELGGKALAMGNPIQK